MQITEFYRGFLKSLGLQIDEHGAIWASNSALDAPMAIKIDGKQLLLPIKENLRGDPEFIAANVVFHPICQSSIRKESKVFKQLRKLVAARLYCNLIVLLEKLLSFSVTGCGSFNPSPDALRILAEISGGSSKANEKALSALESVLNAATPNSTHRLVNIYLKKGQDGKDKFTSMANVVFPIFDEYVGTKPRIFDVAINSKASYDAILSTFKAILPNSDEPGAYNCTSNSLIAPEFHALAAAYAKLASKMNKVIEAFREMLPNPDELVSDLSWVDGLDNFVQYRAELPVQEGNQGEPMDNSGSNMPLIDPQAIEVNTPAPLTANPTMTQNMNISTPAMSMPAVQTPTPATASVGIGGLKPLGGPLDRVLNKSSFGKPDQSQSFSSDPADKNNWYKTQLENEKAAMLQAQQQQLIESMKNGGANNQATMAALMANPALQAQMQQAQQMQMLQQMQQSQQQQQLLQMQQMQQAQQANPHQVALRTLQQQLTTYAPQIMQWVESNPLIQQCLTQSLPLVYAASKNPMILMDMNTVQQVMSNTMTAPQLPMMPVMAMPQMNMPQMPMVNNGIGDMNSGRAKAMQQKQYETTMAQMNMGFANNPFPAWR